VSSQLRVAIVGCGQIADAHLQEIAKVPSARVVAVCDRLPDLARQAAERFSIPEMFDDLGRMLDKVRPDVVHITTPPHTHASLARQALEANAHVYVEKPFTVDTAEAESVFEVARAKTRLVCVGHDHLFDPCWVELQRRRAAGELGKVVHIDTVLGYDVSGPFGRVMFNDPAHWVHRLPGGLFHNNLSHALYKITDLLPDDRPAVWSAWFGNTGRTGAPTELRIVLRGREVTGSILFTSAARPVQRITRVYGSREFLEVDFDGRLLRRRTSIGAPGPFAKIAVPLSDLGQAARSLVRNLWRFVRSDLHYFAGMNRLFRLFYQAILTGGAPPIAEEEIRRVTAIMDDVFAAARSGDRPPDGGPSDALQNGRCSPIPEWVGQ
jgi:predicted dehydrogenase